MLLLVVYGVVAFPDVIRKEKWKDGTFSGWSYGVIIGYLYTMICDGSGGPRYKDG